MGRTATATLSRPRAAARPRIRNWYENLAWRPEVWVQVMADRFTARARTAMGAEKATLWKTMTAISPLYEEYQARTTREIPVVIIERV